MRVDPMHPITVRPDEWLEDHCRALVTAGRDLAACVGHINERMEQAQNGNLGRRRRVTEAQFRQAEAACRALHDVQIAVQNALFDCEHELRSLRERDVSPAELLLDGEKLIGRYRFLRRRARVIDALLAYLPPVSTYSASLLDHLRRVRDSDDASGIFTVPDCGFALVALEQLREEDASR